LEPPEGATTCPRRRSRQNRPSPVGGAPTPAEPPISRRAY